MRKVLLVVAIIGLMVNSALAAENSKRNEGLSSQGVDLSGGIQAKEPFNKALEAYDKAFQSRDLVALKQILADDVVMFEQGAQNLGREDVLNKHLGPELQSFQGLSATYYEQRVRESGHMATVTRQFSIKAMKQGRLLTFSGSETQGWEHREGRWYLTHIHYSFPGR